MYRACLTHAAHSTCQVDPGSCRYKDLSVHVRNRIAIEITKATVAKRHGYQDKEKDGRDHSVIS